MAKKVFKGKFFTEIEYEVIDERWIDDDTYVVIFNDMEDKDGDTYHLEVEYHKDEDRVTFVRVYEHEVVEADYLITYGFKRDIEEYVLGQVGKIDGMLSRQKIAIELTLDVDPSTTIGQMQDILKNLKIEVTSDSAKVIKVVNLGWTNNK